MEINNNFPNNNFMEPVDSSLLLYKDNSQQENCVSKMTDFKPFRGLQYVSNEIPALNITNALHVDNDNNNIINIQLLYDSNSSTKLELWDSTFHPVSLHGSLEHLLSDSKKIKESLTYLVKYIKNKKINSGKSNNIEDFRGIGEATWRFVTAIYKSG